MVAMASDRPLAVQGSARWSDKFCRGDLPADTQAK